MSPKQAEHSHWYQEGYSRGEAAAADGVTIDDNPQPLSGEWAGESIPEIFGSWEAATDEAMDEYEAGYYDALVHLVLSKSYRVGYVAGYEDGVDDANHQAIDTSGNGRCDVCSVPVVGATPVSVNDMDESLVHDVPSWRFDSQEENE